MCRPLLRFVRSAFDALHPPTYFAFFKANGAKGWAFLPQQRISDMWKLRELVFWLSGVGLLLGRATCRWS